jgi:hypothetical protein
VLYKAKKERRRGKKRGREGTRRNKKVNFERSYLLQKK